MPEKPSPPAIDFSRSSATCIFPSINLTIFVFYIFISSTAIFTLNDLKNQFNDCIKYIDFRNFAIFISLYATLIFLCFIFVLIPTYLTEYIYEF
jgi:ABC-type uncharacterized transport system fused permease/ATPase subunit